MPHDPLTVVHDPARLAALRRLDLLDSPAEEAFDRLARLAAAILRTPMVLLSLVDEDRQFFKSCLGLPEPWCTWRQTPLSHSFCQHVVASGKPLVVANARQHPLVQDNLAIRDLRWIAYLGIPLRTADHHTIGSFCVTDTVERSWHEQEVMILQELATSVSTEIELRRQRSATAHVVQELTHAQTRLAHEIAAHRRTRQALAMLESTADGMITLDGQGRIVSFNAAAERLFGYTAAEVLGQPMGRLMPFPYGEATDVPVAPALRDGEHRVVDTGREVIGQRKDGTPVSLGLSVSAFCLESQPLLTAIVHDLSARQQTEAALLQSETRFRRLVEEAPNAIVMVDQQGLVQLVNRPAEQLFGYPRTALLGQPVERLVPAPARASHRLYRHRFLEDPQTRPMGAGRDLHGVRHDGSEVPIEIALSSVAMPEGLYTLATVIDITARKDAEQRLRASLDEKESLLQEIHHRVKNNLQIITSLLRMQARGAPEPAVVAVLRESQARIGAMALIHEKLYQSSHLASVSFADYARDLVSSLFDTYRLQTQHIHLQIDVENHPLHLDQAIPCGLILNELISNCLKHAFPQGRHGTIQVGFHVSGESQCCLRVQDDGVGMPPLGDLGQIRSLGLRLIHTLTAQLNGVFEMQAQHGTAVEVRFASSLFTKRETQHASSENPGS